MPFTPARLRCLVAVCVFVFCTAPTTVRDSTREFTVVIPDGFEPNTEEARENNPNVLYSFIRYSDKPVQNRTVITITKLGGTLPRNLSSEERTKDGVRFEFAPVVWKSHTLHRSIAKMTVGGKPVTVLHVSVPLKPMAISIVVGGDQGAEPELESILKQVLDSVEGQSSWAAVDAAGAQGFWCCGGIVAVGVIIYLMRRKQSVESVGPGAKPVAQ